MPGLSVRTVPGLAGALGTVQRSEGRAGSQAGFALAVHGTVLPLLDSCAQLWESHLYWEVGRPSESSLDVLPGTPRFRPRVTGGHSLGTEPKAADVPGMLSLTPAPGVPALSVHLCVRSRARSWPSLDISPYPAREPDPWPATLTAGEASWASRPQ